jgi:hypothetical protein
MKKILLLVLSLFMLSGCEPTDWDVNTNSKWSVWAEGQILSITSYRPSFCNISPVCETECTKHGGTNRRLRFAEGQYAVNKTRDPGRIRLGQKGTLYKYDTGKPDCESWFQWVPYAVDDKKSLINY